MLQPHSHYKHYPSSLNNEHLQFARSAYSYPTEVGTICCGKKEVDITPTTDCDMARSPYHKSHHIHLQPSELL